MRRLAWPCRSGVTRGWETAVVSSREIDRYLRRSTSPSGALSRRCGGRSSKSCPRQNNAISYGVPAFKVRGKTVAGFAAFKHHLSYLPHSGSVLPALGDDVARFEQDKGIAAATAIDKPLPSVS